MSRPACAGTDQGYFRPIPGFPRYRIGRNNRVWFNRVKPGLPPPWDTPVWVVVRQRPIGGVAACRLRAEGREFTRSVKLLREAAFSANPDAWVERIGPAAPERPYFGTAWDGDDLVYDECGDPVLPLCAARGSRNGRSRLDENDALEIRALQAAGQPLAAIVERFAHKASKGTVHAVLAGRTWRHVGLPPAPSDSRAGAGRRRRPLRARRLAELLARARDAAYTLHIRAERCSRPWRRAPFDARADILAARIGRLEAAAVADAAGTRAPRAPNPRRSPAAGEAPP